MSHTLPSPIRSGVEMPGDLLGAILLRFDIVACMGGVSASCCLLFHLPQPRAKSSLQTHFASDEDAPEAGFPDPHPPCVVGAARLAPAPSVPGRASYTLPPYSCSADRQPTNERLRHWGSVCALEVRRSAAGGNQGCAIGACTWVWVVTRGRGKEGIRILFDRRSSLERENASPIWVNVVCPEEAATAHEQFNGYSTRHRCTHA